MNITYLMQTYDFMKIGRSSKFRERYKDYNVCNPLLEIIAIYDAKVFPEKHLHERFSGSWHKGEWFRITDEMKEFVQRNTGSDIKGRKEFQIQRQGSQTGHRKNVGRRKIYPADLVERIVSLRSRGYSIRAIGEEVNQTHDKVHRILRRNR